MLKQINSPEDLRTLKKEELPAACDALRSLLLESVAETGGHFAAGLGTIELTIALHYVFNTPDDRLIWDVGHQAYGHKILTGRRDEITSIRKKDGLAPFPRREESDYDAFGVGHSSTSISAALGMALAAKQLGTNRQSVAIIGDGAMTAGMAYEALNHAADLDANMLVVLNDNEMSISPNVGGLSKYLTRLLSGRFYSAVREGSKKVLSNTPGMKRFARRAEEHTKGMLLPSTLFEEMGFLYYGPVDGHDVLELVKILENIKDIDEPKFLHVVTQKGKGYKPAEQDPCAYHAVPAFNLKTGVIPPIKKKKDTPTYTQVFSEWICDMAAKDDRLVAITPAMREGSGLVEFSEQYPERYYDVAIAEQHAVTLAAGMACEGIKPIVAIYSTFLQRAYDQLIHDVALQNLPVVFAIDRAGLVGADGATHSGNYDFSYLRCIPNMIIMAPADENECRQMLYTAFLQETPTAVRYPRGKGVGITPEKQMQAIEIGKAKTLQQGSRIAILLFGSLLTASSNAADRLGATLINMRFVKPLDETLLREIAQTHDVLVTIEDNAVNGGAGSGVNEFLLQESLSVAILNLGIPDEYLEHAEREQQLALIGLDADGLVQSIQAFNQTILASLDMPQKRALLAS
ncbi:MAG TPA: 1-deoxy-D-xylulose-5-phosphate synthase [Leucothrix mucor]|nr:1-deoxy-D-xylulose-5-phosphate synthase [Leucothrix mucor]